MTTHRARRLWFWQKIVSPHMTGLARELAFKGSDVVYAAERLMSEDRERLGWSAPSIPEVRVELFDSWPRVEALVRSAEEDSIHICAGVRGNRLLERAQDALARRGLRQWVIMETVDDAALLGRLKRVAYRHALGRRLPTTDGMLAIGYRTPDWLVSLGVPPERLFSFAYFLDRGPCATHQAEDPKTSFRILYVGQFIRRKRIELLFEAAARLHDGVFELVVVGSGPLAGLLRERARSLLGDRVRWAGQLLREQVPPAMAMADALVLPSRHDGWGAVASEAMMVGTPVICSDACGVAGVVRASGRGTVFPSGDVGALSDVLASAIAAGPVSDTSRRELAAWARCLSAQAGAAYLLQILDHVERDVARPPAPWSVLEPDIHMHDRPWVS